MRRVRLSAAAATGSDAEEQFSGDEQNDTKRQRVDEPAAAAAAAASRSHGAAAAAGVTPGGPDEEEPVRCCICLDEFECDVTAGKEDRTPRVLQCGHNSCGDCLSKLAFNTLREGGDSIRCPRCRKPHTLKGAAAAPSSAAECKRLFAPSVDLISHMRHTSRLLQAVVQQSMQQASPAQVPLPQAANYNVPPAGMSEGALAMFFEYQFARKQQQLMHQQPAAAATFSSTTAASSASLSPALFGNPSKY